MIVGEVYDSIEVLKNSNTPSKEDFARLEAALDAQIKVLDQRIRGAELQAAAVQNLAQFELASARDSLGGQSVAAPPTQPLRILMLQNVSQALASQGNASRNVTLLLIQGLSSSFAGASNATQGILAVGQSSDSSNAKNDLFGSSRQASTAFRFDRELQAAFRFNL